MVFTRRFTTNNIVPKLQKCWTHKIAFEVISKMLKQPNFFHSQPSTLPKKAFAKFYLSTTFGSSFMIPSVAPTRLSTFYAYLVTKIGNRNLMIPTNLFGSMFVSIYMWDLSSNPLCTLLCMISGGIHIFRLFASFFSSRLSICSSTLLLFSLHSFLYCF